MKFEISVEDLVVNMTENHLRWFVHVQLRSISAPFESHWSTTKKTRVHQDDAAWDIEKG